MQDTEAVDAQLRDQVWTYAQRGVIVLVFFLAGLLLGYRFWGKAGELQEQVEELTERNQSLTKERDTERSRVTLIERDKKELERLLEEAKGAAAAARAKVEEAAEASKNAMSDTESDRTARDQP